MKNSIILKMLAIGFLAIVLLIPTAMIQELINERQTTRDNAIDEASSKWSREQAVFGPVIVLPYKTLTQAGGKVVENTNFAYFAPEILDIDGSASSETLERGIYKIAAYKSSLSFKGKFNQPDMKSVSVDPGKVMWDQAKVFVGLSDARGIKEDMELAWNDKKSGFSSWVSNIRFVDTSKTSDSVNLDVSSGVVAPISLGSSTGDSQYDFSFALQLNGSKMLYFSPVAAVTTAKLSSDWPTPSFDGSFLPDNRTVDQAGFKADWKVLELNRSMPSAWTSEDQVSINRYLFGTKFIVGVDEYQKNIRAVKYSIMIIALTFLIFFFIEVINKTKIHPIQYTLVGLALCLFYSLLLSFSEYIGFNLAYLAASIMTLGSVTMYSAAIFKNMKLSLLQGSILVLIYGFIFTILQLEDYALLVGNIGLFITLSTVMFLSRKVDWYEVGQKKLE